MSGTAVFDPDATPYHTFRIPALLAIPPTEPANAPILLAFCEGRVASAGDSGVIDLVLRRSLDGGRTWEPLQVVSSVAGKTSGNPAPIQDPASGDLVLLSVQNGADVDEHALATGHADPADTRRVMLQRSTDLGVSWSAPTEITDTVKRPDWGWYATGPCHGIALRHGPHRGRLVVPANHSRLPAGDIADDQLPPLNGGHAILSDDGGHSWRIGFVDDNDETAVNANESTVAELTDGRLVFNARNHRPDSDTHRVQAISTDGGETLTGPYQPCPTIASPQIQASMISPDGHTLLLSTPAPDRREDLTVYVSTDAGSWRRGPVINPGPSGYSDLTQLGDDRIGVLYETGDSVSHERICFDTWTVTELTDPSKGPSL